MKTLFGKKNFEQRLTAFQLSVNTKLTRCAIRHELTSINCLWMAFFLSLPLNGFLLIYWRDYRGSASSCSCKITLAKNEFTPAILFLFGLRIIHSVGGEWCSLARDSEPIRFLKIPRSLSVYILILDNTTQNKKTCCRHLFSFRVAKHI